MPGGDRKAEACDIRECDEYRTCARKGNPRSCPLYRMMQRNDLAVWKGARSRAVVRVSKMTGRVERRYETPADAGRDLGVAGKAVARACSDRTFADGGYYLRYEDDYDPAEEFGGDKKSVPYVVVDVEEMAASHADTAEDAARMLGASTKTVYKLAREGGLLKGRFAVIRRRYADGFLAMHARLSAERMSKDRPAAR